LWPSELRKGAVWGEVRGIRFPRELLRVSRVLGVLSFEDFFHPAWGKRRRSVSLGEKRGRIMGVENALGFES